DGAGIDETAADGRTAESAHERDTTGLPPRTSPPWKLNTWLPQVGVGAPSAGAGERKVTGDTLRARRESLGVSQAAVAHAAHCSRGLVAEVERGKRRSAQTLAHLDEVMDRLEQQARRN
ncbi:MAG: helix-turn-helix transcriptional regulator, partial [Chloroflexota bacterium]|nr:helix-turn-helix transcriptional regulator [Chloroflexota bacterium]